jgi:hypothetical protein
MLPWPRRGCEPPRPLFELPCGPNRVALAALNECIGKLAAVEPTSDLDPRIAAWLRNGPAAIDWRRRTEYVSGSFAHSLADAVQHRTPDLGPPCDGLAEHG